MKWFVREPLKTPDLILLDKFHRINVKEAHDMLLEMERGMLMNFYFQCNHIHFLKLVFCNHRMLYFLLAMTNGLLGLQFHFL